jgi:hypothetical protein
MGKRRKIWDPLEEIPKAVRCPFSHLVILLLSAPEDPVMCSCGFGSSLAAWLAEDIFGRPTGEALLMPFLSRPLH